MATVSQATQHVLTAEEFAIRPDPGYPEELVRGRIVAMPMPGARLGKICAKVARILGNQVDDHDLGHVLSNDSGVITERGPDSVRGADVSFYSYGRLPKGTITEGYPNVPPDLVVEVLSPHDRWPKVLAKVAEYLNAGVSVVTVLDPEKKTLHLYAGDEPVRNLEEADELSLPAIFGDFHVGVGSLFV